MHPESGIVTLFISEAQAVLVVIVYVWHSRSVCPRDIHVLINHDLFSCLQGNGGKRSNSRTEEQNQTEDPPASLPKSFLTSELLFLTHIDACFSQRSALHVEAKKKVSLTPKNIDSLPPLKQVPGRTRTARCKRHATASVEYESLGSMGHR
jgi:hypothetical protein